VRRHLMPTRRLSLTDFKCDIRRGAREKALKGRFRNLRVSCFYFHRGELYVN
jgi:hypothetical protein